MADYAFGGNDDETAELKKLNADVVCYRALSPVLAVAYLGSSSKTATVMMRGKSWCALQNQSMEA